MAKLSPILFLARNDLRIALREKTTLLWLFVMPPIFFFFIGTITGGFSGGPSDVATPLLIENHDRGFLSAHLEARLAENRFELVHPEDVAAGEGAKPPPRSLSIPEDFSRGLLEQDSVEIIYTGPGEGFANDYDKFRIQRAAYATLADLVVLASRGEAVGPQALAALREGENPLRLEVRPAGRLLEIPSGFDQAIPGTLVMFTLLILLTSGASLLISEREQQLLRRLASVPFSRAQVVAGKWAGRMALAVVQVGFALLVGSFVFGMDWGVSLPMVLIVLFAWGALCTSLALLLGSLAKTQNQAVGLGVFSSMTLAALGGCWWPIEVAPEWMQTIGYFLPTGWTMDAMHKLVNFGFGWQAALPHLAILSVTALGVGWLAARRFRFI